MLQFLKYRVTLNYCRGLRDIIFKTYVLRKTRMLKLFSIHQY
jgi:hypothetical protein